jgi:hypothetical protein
MRGFESSLPSHYDFRRAVSSRGPGRSPLKAKTGVRIPVPLPTTPSLNGDVQGPAKVSIFSAWLKGRRAHALLAPFAKE